MGFVPTKDVSTIRASIDLTSYNCTFELPSFVLEKNRRRFILTILGNCFACSTARLFSVTPDTPPSKLLEYNPKTFRAELVKRTHC